MNTNTRIYDQRVARVVEDAGARIIASGIDGKNHRVITIEHHAQRRKFHYASTGRRNGCALKNTEQRLKRLLGTMAIGDRA